VICVLYIFCANEDVLSLLQGRLNTNLCSKFQLESSIINMIGMCCRLVYLEVSALTG
jgi:hypothetical protein